MIASIFEKYSSFSPTPITSSHAFYIVSININIVISVVFKQFFASFFSVSVPSKGLMISTPYNVGSVLWRLFSTLEVVQYIGGITSVLWGDSFSTVEVVQYSGEIASVLWGIASVLWRLFSTVGDNISTCGG